MSERTAFPSLRASRSVALLLAATLPTTALAQDLPDAQANAVAPSSTQTPEASDAVKAATVTALMTERADWQGRNTGLVGPIVFTAAGAAVLGVGIGLHAAYEDNHGLRENGSPKDGALNTLSIVAIIAGAAALSTGGVLWVLRTSEGRQEQELRRIDDRLKAFGVHASLTPWFVPRAAQVAGASGGLRLSLEF